MEKENREVAEDLIKYFSKDREGRILLRRIKQGTEEWQDYDKVKGEIK